MKARSKEHRKDPPYYQKRVSYKNSFGPCDMVQSIYIYIYIYIYMYVNVYIDKRKSMGL